MVWKEHCAIPVGPVRQNWLVPVWATADCDARTASVNADAVISVRMFHPLCMGGTSGGTNDWEDRSGNMKLAAEPATSITIEMIRRYPREVWSRHRGIDVCCTPRCRSVCPRQRQRGGEVPVPPAGGIALPPGDGAPAPEPVVPWSWVRSKHWDDNPAGFADSHCAMVWKLHCAAPVGPLRQNWPVPVWAMDGVVRRANVTADAAISVRMVSPRVCGPRRANK